MLLTDFLYCSRNKKESVRRCGKHWLAKDIANSQQIDNKWFLFLFFSILCIFSFSHETNDTACFQDALEYFQYMMNVMEREERAKGENVDPSKVWMFKVLHELCFDCIFENHSSIIVFDLTRNINLFFSTLILFLWDLSVGREGRMSHF